MKTTIVVILFFLACINCQAQEKKIELGLGLFPNLSFAIQTNDGTAEDEILIGYQGMEIAKPAISSTIFVEYNLNKKSIIGLGIGYQNNGNQTKKRDLVWGINPDTGEAILDPSAPSQARRHHHSKPLGATGRRARPRTRWQESAFTSRCRAPCR